MNFESIVLAFLITSFVSAIILSTIFFTVEQQHASIVELFGKFVRITNAGLNTKSPLHTIAGTVSLKLRQLNINIETKTFDNVFVNVNVVIQYRILEDKIFEAFYSLEEPQKQIQSFVFDVVRSEVPKITLDHLFAEKDRIALSVKLLLKDSMNKFGYEITDTLVTDIVPDARVRKAMNEINEAQRLRVAAIEKAEAEKIATVTQAAAKAESDRLHGEGIAAQRKAIVEGLRVSFDGLKQSLPDAAHHQVIVLILMGQYFDTLQKMAEHGKTNTIMIPHGPNSINETYQQMFNAMISDLSSASKK